MCLNSVVAVFTYSSLKQAWVLYSCMCCDSVILYNCSLVMFRRSWDCSAAAQSVLAASGRSGWAAAPCPSLASQFVPDSVGMAWLRLLHLLDTFKITKWTTDIELTFVRISLLYSYPSFQCCPGNTFENSKIKRQVSKDELGKAPAKIFLKVNILPGIACS